MENVYPVIIADTVRVIAYLVLLLKICKTSSACGISVKTQYMFALAYSLKYLELISQIHTYSMYNIHSKMFFTLFSCFFVISVKFLFSKTYQQEHDTFRIELLIIPVIFTSYVCHDYAEPNGIKVLYNWSIYLEAVALIPQLWMIKNSGTTNLSMIIFMAFITINAGMRMSKWVYFYYNETFFKPYLAAGGIISIFVGLIGVIYAINVRRKSQSQSNAPNASSIFVIPMVHERFEKESQTLFLNETKDANTMFDVDLNSSLSWVK